MPLRSERPGLCVTAPPGCRAECIVAHEQQRRQLRQLCSTADHNLKSKCTQTKGGRDIRQRTRGTDRWHIAISHDSRHCLAPQRSSDVARRPRSLSKARPRHRATDTPEYHSLTPVPTLKNLPRSLTRCVIPLASNEPIRVHPSNSPLLSSSAMS